jgi:protein-S-isoprenylcysteine O-methyltransferase Ste14
MVFPKRYAETVARMRVTAGFVVAALFIALSEPTIHSLGLGASVALPGMLLRGWAAGHLEKNQRLTTSGPFAHLRNPLYVGTLITGLGFAAASNHIGAGALMPAFFLLFYLPVVEEEEGHLRKLFPDYAEYETCVGKFLPSFQARYRAGKPFQWDLYLRNREYQALAGFCTGMALLAGKTLLWGWGS